MVSVYDLLKKHAGKVVYIDFWGVVCPPCLAEMEPLKELRKRYSPNEVVMIIICGSGNRKAYRNSSSSTATGSSWITVQH